MHAVISCRNFILSFALALASALAGQPAAHSQTETPHLLKSEALAVLNILSIQKSSLNPEWRALLHCLPLQGEECTSRVATQGFFLSPQGKNDPDAELQAMVSSLFDSAQASDPADRTRCRYPARFEWIKTQAGELASTIPNPACPALDEWMTALNPSGLTLIFPSSFINNPASAFGHTFIRIDQPNQTEETRLLAYSVNFAANTQGEAALLYAFNGVFGGYDGFFSVAPYYEKVTKYSDLENRDIWEYPLNFSPSEVRRVVLHVWELRDVPFYYYYFDENCSYQLLSLLEVARPSLALSSEVNLWVIPVDTIRAIQDRQGLIEKSIYRPSLATKLRHEISLNSNSITELAKTLATPEQAIDETALQKLSTSERIQTLDLAYDMLTYTRIRERRDDAVSRERGWKLLSLRSAISTPSTLPPPQPPAVRPENGHGTMKLTAGMGLEDGDLYETLAFRGAFHDQLDSVAGYIPGAQIKFLDLQLRYDTKKELSVDRFTFFDIESLSPRDVFFHPLSWNVRLGSERERISTNDWAQVWGLQAGGGMSKSVGENGLLYGLLESELQASSALDTALALGAGPRLGLILPFNDRWAVEAKTLYEYFFAGDEHSKFESSISQRVSLDKHFALRLGYHNIHDVGEVSNRVMLELEYFATPVW
ncbi:MAG: DUF4105 domain-containing protein [Deltaproteobacteria bacterium]|nr:DUF4105 domain-containing protein [Deltaproteobacteria bacterium]